MTARETFAAWLRDAYAMEQQLVTVLENHASAAEDHPRIEARIREHVEETRRHAEQVKQCLERLGESTSTAKTAMAKLSGWAAGLAPAGASDTLVKSALADYSTEHFEIACYRALITAAQSLGEADMVETFRGIIADEERMAGWLEETLPQTVLEHLAQHAGRTR